MGSVRITGGRFGGRILKIPKSDAIRPTQDRVREALFNILAPEIAGAEFLDLFAGSGAVGIEALSRGASKAVFVEQNRVHIDAARANLSSFGVTASSTLVCADVRRWIASCSGPGFTIAFADPPYAMWEEIGLDRFLSTLAGRGVVRPDGLFVAETSSVRNVGETPGWDVLRDRRYGKTRITIFRRLAVQS